MNDSCHYLKFNQALNYFDLIDWENEPCTEPPLTMEYSLDSIMAIIGDPLTLPPYPNHTQAVEKMVRVVTEVATKKAGYHARQRHILKLLESREMVPKFNTKNHDTQVLDLVFSQENFICVFS